MRGIYFSLLKTNLVVADGKDSPPCTLQSHSKHLCSHDFLYTWKMLLNRLTKFLIYIPGMFLRNKILPF